MAELNFDAVEYALQRVRTEYGIGPDDVLAFIEHYEDYERDSWLTTQE